jgi:GDPmannose 4,6-dehydratase
MWLILQQENPDDYVIATGETHSVREFTELAFKEVGIEILWKGKGSEEVGIDSSTGKILVEIDPRYYRPTEVDILIGDPSKAKEKLGWEPKVKLEELVKIMIKADEKAVEQNHSFE